MTYARSQLVDDSQPGFYHCVSRCVRRAFLCGKDHYTGRSYEHRKGWVEDRLHTLAQAFSVSIYAYAVMSNHLHVVIRVDPTAVADWTDEEVARRWTHAYAGQYGDVPEQAVLDARVEQLLQQPDRLLEVRARLGSLSWFMRALNEPIARMANREDHCTGHFWEGRFKSQVLLDEQAVLSCMAYVDLNPVRAGICDTLEDSDHTSIQQRLKETRKSVHDRRAKKTVTAKPLGPLVGLRAAVRLSISQTDYIDLVEWTGQHSRPDKRGRLHKSEQPAQTASAARPRPWLTQVLGTETRFYRAIGSPAALRAAAESIGQHWLKGVRLAYPTGT
jgi:REP element-mobilizing transposase RayT